MPIRAGEQIDLWLLPAPVLAQRFQELQGHGNIAIARALALLDVNHHTLTVDVIHLEQRSLGAANAGSVQNHQNRAMHQVGRGLNHASDFLGAQHNGQLPGRLWKDQIVVSDITPF